MRTIQWFAYLGIILIISMLTSMGCGSNGGDTSRTDGVYNDNSAGVNQFTVSANADPYQLLNLGMTDLDTTGSTIKNSWSLALLNSCKNDASPPTVRFYNANGYSVTVPTIYSNPLTVSVPIYIDPNTGYPGSGQVSLEVKYPDGRSFTVNGTLTIADLPAIYTQPGELTLAYIDSLKQSLGSASENLATIQSNAQFGTYITQDIQQLLNATQLDSLRNAITNVMTNGGSVELGTYNSIPLIIDSTTLSIMDREIYALTRQVTSSKSGRYCKEDIIDQVKNFGTILSTIGEDTSNKYGKVVSCIGIGTIIIGVATSSTSIAAIGGTALVVGITSKYLLSSAYIMTDSIVQGNTQSPGQAILDSTMNWINNSLVSVSSSISQGSEVFTNLMNSASSTFSNFSAIAGELGVINNPVATPTTTPTPTISPSPIVSASPNSTVSPSPTPSPTNTITPSPTPSPTTTITPSPTPTSSPSSGTSDAGYIYITINAYRDDLNNSWPSQSDCTAEISGVGSISLEYHNVNGFWRYWDNWNSGKCTTVAPGQYNITVKCGAKSLSATATVTSKNQSNAEFNFDF